MGRFLLWRDQIQYLFINTSKITETTNIITPIIINRSTLKVLYDIED